MANHITLPLSWPCQIKYLIFMTRLPAHSGEEPMVHPIASPPSCVNNNGDTVVFKNVENGQGDSAASIAKRNENGDPVVYGFNYKHSPTSLQQFIDLHECVHHQTSDVDLPHPPRNSPAHMMNESIADCIAKMRIKDEIHGRKDVVLQAVKQLMKAMTKIGFHEATTNSRKANILYCLSKENSADLLIEDILRHRKLE